MRVVRFYVSCLLLSSSFLLLLLHNRDPRRTLFSVGPQPRPSTPSVPCRTSTTTIPAQCSLPDLNHDHPRPVFPAGPQPRISTPCVPCRTSCRKLWTSTWDLPSSVCTAGLQRPDRMPEDMPDRMSDRMPEDMPDRMPEDMSDKIPEEMPDRMTKDMSDRIPEDMPEDMPDRMPDRMPEDMSDRMPEDLPIRKSINVMVGITRSKIFIFFSKKYILNPEIDYTWIQGPFRKYTKIIVITIYPITKIKLKFKISPNFMSGNFPITDFHIILR